MVGLAILLVLLVLFLGAPLFTNADPTDMVVEDILKAPSAEHLFGTDYLGRDLFSRVLYGGRTSLLVAVVVMVVTSFSGAAIGAIAAYYPRLDSPIMRCMDILMSLPTMMLAMGVMAILGRGLNDVIIALIISVTPRTAQVLRGVVLSYKQQDFVTAARAVGLRDWRIIVRHLLPNSMPTLLVRQTYIFGIAILAEGGLDFLGVGVPPQVPTLGAIVADGRNYLRDKPWVSFSGGLAIALLVLAVNFLGDGLRDALDPRMKT
jgi:peptide/nickel transport system permease protein